jgi:hypothetical protein
MMCHACSTAPLLAVNYVCCPPLPPRHPAAVLFGLMILFVIVATATCFYMRFGRWASFAVAMVWLITAIMCLVGIGG